MSTDERLRADAEQLEALLEGRASESDPAVRAVFERRPEWREVFEHAREDTGDGAPWSGEASEADRRLVAECLAQARTPAPPTALAPVRPLPRPWTKWLALAAATLLVAWLARLWLADEPSPVRPKGAVLQSTGEVGFFASGEAAEGYRQFKWESKGLVAGKEYFVLTVWALDSSGALGDQLLRERADEPIYSVSPEKCASWPDRVLWRVACTDDFGPPRATREWFAERSRH